MVDASLEGAVVPRSEKLPYIVPSWRWHKEEGYEEGVSVGPESWPTIEAAIPW